MTTVQAWVRIPIHVQLRSTGFPAELRVTAFSSRFTRLMVIRTHGEDAVTPTPKGRESHPHRNQVIQVTGPSDDLPVPSPINSV